jgi:TRAP-type C4-dicarboxylate transport system permease small subunit
MVGIKSETRASGWLRSISVVLVIMSAIILVLHGWRWAHGLGHWHDALPGLAFLTLALTNLLEGAIKQVLLFISLVLLIAAVATLIPQI